MIKAKGRVWRWVIPCAAERAGLCCLGVICPVIGSVIQYRVTRQLFLPFLLLHNFVGLSIDETKVRGLEDTL